MSDLLTTKELFAMETLQKMAESLGKQPAASSPLRSTPTPTSLTQNGEETDASSHRIEEAMDTSISPVKDSSSPSREIPHSQTNGTPSPSRQEAAVSPSQQSSAAIANTLQQLAQLEHPPTSGLVQQAARSQHSSPPPLVNSIAPQQSQPSSIQDNDSKTYNTSHSTTLCSTGKSVPSSESESHDNMEDGQLTEGETFEGKIVYNPDGSAYIIEGDSDLSDTDSLAEEKDGIIIDHKGKNATSQMPSFPQIANAFYIHRNPQTTFYNHWLQMLPPERRPHTEDPIMHSYRVYDLRSGKREDKENKDSNSDSPAKAAPVVNLHSGDVTSVPTKPVLMCFICKLSFGYAKSFTAHAMGEHGMSMNEDEKEVMCKKNSSAIIQGLGKSKDPLMSFLEPVLPPNPRDGLGNKPILPAVVLKSATRLPATSVSYVHTGTKVTPMEQNSASSPEKAATERPPSNGELSPSSHIPSSTGSNPPPPPANGANNLAVPASASPGSAGASSVVPSSPLNSSHSSTSSDMHSTPHNLSDVQNNNINAQKSDMSVPPPQKTSSPPSLLPASSSRLSSSSSVAADSVSTYTTSQPGSSPQQQLAMPPIQGIVIRAGCEDHPNGNITGEDCAKCDHVLGQVQRNNPGQLGLMHSRNSCKTLKCPKCNWHYKYQETLEIHMKEKHPENDAQCIYCLTNQAHPRLARGEVYTCGYKPYRCEVCNYSTTTKGNLSIHMQSDKHINNMQELQQAQQQAGAGAVVTPGAGTPDVVKMPPSQPPATSQTTPPHSHSQDMAQVAAAAAAKAAIAAKPKPKPSWRCDVCNYETNVARNLRIHMTSEKHTHNMMVLQQNVKHMQRDMQFQLGQMAMMDPAAAMMGLPPPPPGMPPFGFDPSMFMGMPGFPGMPPGMETLPMDLTKQELAGQHPAVPQQNGLSNSNKAMDVKNNNEPTKMFQCAICEAFSVDSVEAMHQHMQLDRTKTGNEDHVQNIAGTNMCQLCQYKTNLKANFQLHCKTDKHLQRLQLVNHIREGGRNNEWRLKYMANMSNPVQVRCNACDYYTNSIHKLQLHTTNPRHDSAAKLFQHLRNGEARLASDRKYYHCTVCNYSSRGKLNLIQHVRSMKHMRNESLRLMQLKEQGREHEYVMDNVFTVREYAEDEDVKFDEDEASDCEEAVSEDKESSAESSAQKEATPGDSEEGMQLKAQSSSASSSAGVTSANGEPVHMCPYCNYSSVSEMRIKAHIVSQHTQHGASAGAAPLPTLACPLCQEKFTEKTKLEGHLMQVHNVNREGLQKLLLLVEQQPPEPTAASSAPFSNPTTPKHHASPSRPQASTPSAAPKSPSEEVGDPMAEMLESQALRLAEEASMDGVILSDEKSEDLTFRCQTCAASFTNVDKLCAHQNELGHLELKQTPRGPGYLCWKKGCNQYFKTAPALQMHFREIHARRNVHVSVSERHVYKYRCNQCSLAFKTMDKLQLHSYYHVIRSATKCTMCGRSFRSIAAMRKHVESTHLEHMTPAEMEQYRDSLASSAQLGLLGMPSMEAFAMPHIPGLTPALPGMNMGKDGNPLLAGMPGMITPDKLQGQIADLKQQDSDELPPPEKRIKENGDDHGSKPNGDNMMDTSEKSEKADEQPHPEEYINTQALAENSYQDPSKKYKCHRCKVAFISQKVLQTHNKTLMHRKGDKNSSSGPSFPDDKFNDPNRPFKCDVCKESFTQKNILMVHFNSVSHLHKVKQHSQQDGTDEASSASSPSPGKESPVASTPSSQASSTASITTSTPNKTSAPSPVTSTSNSTQSASQDNQPKPYKCNICKVAYGQSSTLEIHMRSVLHQTKASKLHELALSGEVDINKPLIEQPEADMQLFLQQQQMLAAMQAGLLGPMMGQPPLMFPPIPTSLPQLLPSHIPGMPPASSSNGSKTSTPTTAAVTTPAKSGADSNSTPSSASATPKSATPAPADDVKSGKEDGSTFMCSKCNSFYPSQEELVIHQQMYCYVAFRFKPHVQRNLLENIGFECVMQFNEDQQKIKRQKAEEKQKMENGPQEIKEKVDNSSQENDDGAKENSTHPGNPADEGKKSEEVKTEEKPSMPEMEKCPCSTCGKQFSSVWVLKAHQEEVHKEIVPLNYIEQFGQQFREEFEKKYASQHTAEMPPPETPTSTSTAEVEVKKETPSASTASAEEAAMNSLAADLASAQQAAQMMQLPMFGMFPGMLPGMPPFAGIPGMGAMNMMPPLGMMMPPPEMLGLGSIPGLQGLDPSAVPNIMTSPQSQTPQPPTSAASQQQPHAAAAAAAAAAIGVNQAKRPRTRINDDQLKILRAHFDINNSPSEEQIYKMSEQSGLPAKVIKHWFRNTLFKERQRNKDSPYNFSVPPQTHLNLEEYERTGEIRMQEAEEKIKAEQEAAQAAAKAAVLAQQAHLRDPESNNPSPAPSVSSRPSSTLGSKAETIRDEHKEEQSRYEREDRDDLESIASSVGDSFFSSAPSTPAPVGPVTPLAPTTPLSALGLPPGMVPPGLGMPPANVVASHAEISAALARAFNTPEAKSSTPHSMLSSTPMSMDQHGDPRYSVSMSHSSPSSTSSTPNNSHLGKRANRTRFTDYQLKVLQEYFEQNAYPKDDDLDHLSKMLGLSPRVIVVWFQNARQKARKNYENNPPTGLQDEEARFNRTPGLNYQCKRCLTVFQRYYELIRHQKTQCYKEEQHHPSISTEDSNSSGYQTPSHDSKPETKPEVSSSMKKETSAPTPLVIKPEPKENEKEPTSAHEKKKDAEYKCEKCPATFPRFDLWKEHQTIHLMNPSLFSPFPPESAFAMLQNVAAHQQAEHNAIGAALREQFREPSAHSLPKPMIKHEDSSDSISQGLPAWGVSQSPSHGFKRKAEEEEIVTMDAQGQKRMRTTILPEQLDYLYQQYQMDCNPSRKQLEHISDTVGLKKRVVQVWFQNTRARERKGQYRAHMQIIHKRCPVCRALFRAKSALESHLASKHPERMAKGDIDIDALPDEPLDSMNFQPPTSSSPGPGSSPAPPVPGLDMARLLNNPYNMPSPFMPMVPPPVPQSPNDPLQMSMKKLYEDSLKKYLDDLSTPGSGGKPSSGGEQGRSSAKSPGAASTSSQALSQGSHAEEEVPLDLSKPLKPEENALNMSMDSHASDMMMRRMSMDDSISETHSESTDGHDEHGMITLDSNPGSPNSKGGLHHGPGGMGHKRYRTQMSSLQIKVMKAMFIDYKTPTMAECELLGREIGLAKRVVQVWFQNARAKEKKAKLNYATTFGAEVEFHRAPEECKVCAFKYSHKYTIQDHIFTKNHIGRLKAALMAQGDTGTESSYPDFKDPVIVRPSGATGESGSGEQAGSKSWEQSSEPSLVSHPHLAQLHAMGMQARSVDDDKQASKSCVTEGKDMKSAANKDEHKASDEKKKLPASSAMNPFSASSSSSGGMPSPADISAMMQMSGMMPGMMPPGMPPMPMMPPTMMPGAEMMMYDPTFGTPLPMLQIPPAAIQSIQTKLQSAGCIITRYTQDCKVLADLQPAVPPADFSHMREAMVDVGYICRKCQMVFPGRDACVAHQQMFCYQGKEQSELKSAIIKLEQIQYECGVCASKMATLQEVTQHIQGEGHKNKMAAAGGKVSCASDVPAPVAETANNPGESASSS